MVSPSSAPLFSSNARKYCDAAEPALTIRTSRHAGGLWIDFVDNGSGIDADVQSVIFEKFFRISGEEAEGVGLGLAICQEIMSRLGGQVIYLPIESGAAFRVSLPQSVLVQETGNPGKTAVS